MVALGRGNVAVTERSATAIAAAVPSPNVAPVRLRQAPADPATSPPTDAIRVHLNAAPHSPPSTKGLHPVSSGGLRPPSSPNAAPKSISTSGSIARQSAPVSQIISPPSVASMTASTARADGAEQPIVARPAVDPARGSVMLTVVPDPTKGDDESSDSL